MSIGNFSAVVYDASRDEELLLDGNEGEIKLFASLADAIAFVEYNELVNEDDVVFRPWRHLQE